MPEARREAEIEDFLAQAGWAGAMRVPLGGDASFRHYERLNLDGRRAMLMDAPPVTEDVRPFVRIARHLAGLDLSPPTIMAEDAKRGFLLLEDLGDDTYTRMLAGGFDEEKLYALAVDLLADLHARPASETLFPGLPPYDEAKLLDEACLLTDWFLPAVIGNPLVPAVREEYVEAWKCLLPLILAQPSTIVLRDFHVDNLMWLPDRPGVRACGLLDFQDAVAGAAAYDLMSLLEDARRDIDPKMTARMLDRYFAALPGLDRDAFMAVYAILGAQRHAKVIGIFTRLCRRDGKPGYLVHIPRVWRLLERSCLHPVLAPVKEWLDRHVSPEQRSIPPC